MATIDAVAGRGAERTPPAVMFTGGRSAARPDTNSPAAIPHDVVQVSDAARFLARRSKGADQAAELQLSPELLRELMTAPEPPAGLAAKPSRVES